MLVNVNLYQTLKLNSLSLLHYILLCNYEVHEKLRIITVVKLLAWRGQKYALTPSLSVAVLVWLFILFIVKANTLNLWKQNYSTTPFLTLTFFKKSIFLNIYFFHSSSKQLNWFCINFWRFWKLCHRLYSNSINESIL